MHALRRPKSQQLTAADFVSSRRRLPRPAQDPRVRLIPGDEQNSGGKSSSGGLQQIISGHEARAGSPSGPAPEKSQRPSNAVAPHQAGLGAGASLEAQKSSRDRFGQRIRI